MTGALSMVLIDEVVVSVALPSIQRELHMSQAGLSLVVNSYLLTLAVLIALAGHLSDRFGHVHALVAGVVVFAVTSAAAGLAPNTTVLLVARAVQGAGAALMLPSSQAIVVSTFSLRERGRAMGIYAGVSVGLLSIGPLLGGLLTETVGWEWVFFINLPIAAATLIMVAVARPPNVRQPARRFDPIGLALLVPGIAAVVLGLSQSVEWGWGDPRTIALFAASWVLLVTFVLFELQRREPLVELRLLRRGNFATNTFVLFMVQFTIVGGSVFGAIYAQDVLGLSPIQAGLLFLAVTTPLLFLSTLAGKMYDRVGVRRPVTVGCAVAAVGTLGVALGILAGGYAYLIPGFLVLGTGLALTMVPSNTDAMNATPGELRGAASGMLQTARQIGGALGLAVLTTIIVSFAHHDLNGNLNRVGITGVEAKRLDGYLAESQRDGSTVRFREVPAGVRPTAEAAARDAYGDGILIGWLVLTGAMVAAGGLAALVLREVEYRDEEHASPLNPLVSHHHER